MEKTKDFYPKFHAFFLPDNEDFSHFCRLIFYRNLLHLETHTKGASLEQEKKQTIKFEQKFAEFLFFSISRSTCEIKLRIPVICCNPL